MWLINVYYGKETYVDDNTLLFLLISSTRHWWWYEKSWSWRIWLYKITEILQYFWLTWKTLLATYMKCTVLNPASYIKILSFLGHNKLDKYHDMCCGQLWVRHIICGQTCDGLYRFVFCLINFGIPLDPSRWVVLWLLFCRSAPSTFPATWSTFKGPFRGVPSR